MEIISEQIKIKDLLELKIKNVLSINPEYQRGAVWKDAQQKKLIDSVLRGYPLPLIYLHNKEEMVAGYHIHGLEIIDGQQRINAIHKFGENALKLFDPIKDDKTARFPNFIKDAPCPWASCDFIGLSEDLKTKFLETKLFIVKISTDNEDEARDLFIRLQAGLPLNPQEKRDAWPGGYTEFTLRFGGKREIIRYPGHEFFTKLMKHSSTDRGEIRTLCAQIGMLVFEKATEGNWMNINNQTVDDYYYQKLGFDINSPQVIRFRKILDLAVEIFEGYKGPKFINHEAIHIILLLDSLLDDYTKSWQGFFIVSFDEFRKKVAVETRARTGDYYLSYGVHARTASSSPQAIQARHKFFSEKMLETLVLLATEFGKDILVRKDSIRAYGKLEREIIYYRHKRRCAVCDNEIKWDNLEIHHINEHQNGGQTTIENGVPVHKECHPKGTAAEKFYETWKLKQEQSEKSM
jgi:hypothetical protein